MCLQQMTKEKNWQPVTRLPSPTLWFKNFTSAFLSLGSGSINRKSWRNLPAIPDSPKHRPHWPPHTGSTLCIFLSWPYHDAKFLYDGSSVEGREGKKGHQDKAESPEAQRPSWALFPDLYRVSGKKKWQTIGANSLFKQESTDSCVHCAEWIVQEVDVCILIDGSRKHRET